MGQESKRALAWDLHAFAGIGLAQTLRAEYALVMHAHPRRLSNRAARTALAEREVRRIMDALPPEIREPARRVAVLFFDRPDLALTDEGPPDEVLLGLFEGETLDASNWEGFNLPPQISLFLDNIWEEAAHHPPAFLREVRITFLHELGHYLGLDEDDLLRRGL